MKGLQIFGAVRLGLLLCFGVIVNVASLFLYGDGSASIASSMLSFAYYFVSFAYLKRRNPLDVTLLYMAILTLPLSFISIAGSSYASLPVSWFLVSIVGLFIISFRSFSRIARSFLVPGLVLLFFAISILVHGAAVDALKQIMNILIFFLCLPIAKYFLSNKNIDDRSYIAKNGIRLYVVAALSFAVSLIVQALYINSTGSVIGEYDAFGGGRTSFGGLFSDYSFASLFLASAIIPIFYSLFRKKSIITTAIYGLIIVVLMYALFLTVARTGLVALIITIFALLLYMLLKGNLRTQFAVIVSSLAVAVISLSLLSFMAESRGGQELTDGSGRLEDYGVALNLFSDNILLGVGFGLDAYTDASSGVPIPHNFFVQYLVQGGILGLVLIVVCIVAIYFKQGRGHSVAIGFMLGLLFIGSMFIPDILHSRIIIVVTILYIISRDLFLDRVGVGRMKKLKQDQNT